MRVSAYEHVERCVWQRLRCVLVSVCQEYPFSALHDDGVVRHHWKRQQHLIDFGVAVASDGYDSVRQAVERLGYALGVDAFGYGVAWSVVEYVAQDEQHVAALTAEDVEHGLEPWQRAVYVGYYQVLHGVLRIHYLFDVVQQFGASFGSRRRCDEDRRQLLPLLEQFLLVVLGVGLQSEF